ncbi:betaine--homocysteine S-methyltransferase 1-like [Tachypleus tridentatus]|uniref:betaine--homocysteine S-methyltransferase 1-like n=1 Tax=Tachypleus tridentatus TaxID=6853 RepID=UPI003FD3356B
MLMQNLEHRKHVSRSQKPLRKEFLRAGSDVMQAFTFYASESNRKYRGNEAGENFSV